MNIYDDARPLRVDEIEATSATQVRVRINDELVSEYAEDMKNGAIFPPLVCFAEQGSSRYILADGFHRLAAAVRAELKEIPVKLHEGSLGDALDHALGANATNGARRSSADKRHAVQLALKDPRHQKLTLREVAELCVVSKSLVHDIKQEANQKAQAKKAGTTGKEEPDGNARPTRPPPTQEEIDKQSLLLACSVINGFTFTGYDAVTKLGLGDDEYKAMSNAADWLDSALAPMGEGNDEQD